MHRPPESVETLFKRVQSGDSRALAELGKRFLVGDGTKPAPDKGIALLREAASRGDAEAAALLAVCAAWGVAQARDIQAALDHLQRAAELGWAPALSELQLLARQSGDGAAALRKSIDLAAWTTPPAALVLRERPRIMVLEHFATPAECEWLIRRGSPSLARAKVYRGSAQARTAETRTNRETSFTIFNADVLLSLLRDRISAAAGAPVTHFEIAKLLSYAPGEQFALHADFIEPRTPELVQEIQIRGQRSATFLVYLNEGYEGGETDFPRAGVRYKGARGDALLFSNVDATGAPDYDT
ncbi:MAG: 2OG-Fe(II) oxygenase, partial [Steroidobacteraceae bacterium]